MWHPPDPGEFYPQVWELVRQIPAGRVSTYGDIARLLPPPGDDHERYRRLGARWVGTALRNVVESDHVPWHRVINSQGRISLPYGSTPALTQRQRLEEEGIVFDEKGAVNLDLFGW